MPAVYSKRKSSLAKALPPGHFGVYVGRPSPYGNPFSVDEYGPESAVELYRTWIHEPEQQALRDKIRRDLRGRNLICWCAPNPCHADVILEIANG